MIKRIIIIPNPTYGLESVSIEVPMKAEIIPARTPRPILIQKRVPIGFFVIPFVCIVIGSFGDGFFTLGSSGADIFSSSFFLGCLVN